MEFLAHGPRGDQYFADPDSGFERFQPWPKEAGIELVETSYFGFNIPEANLDCRIHHWIHPHLGGSSGGVSIFSGKKPYLITADYVDHRDFMPLPPSIVNCTWPSGVRIDMIEPMRRFRIEYTDKARDTWFEVEYVAVMPMAVRPDGRRFTQALRTTGKLVLRGVEHKIDGWFTRDRSWGGKRSEKPVAVPPLCWTAGVFDDSFAFHVAAFESPQRHPDYATRYPFIKAGENHFWGYVWNEGKLRGITRVDIYVGRAADGISPESVEMQITDSEGRCYDIRGTVQARTTFQIWANMMGFMSLTRWECDGKVGYGDHQDFNGNDHAAHAYVAPR